MSEKTNIEWCDSTWNPWEGCQKVGPGCDHCYAETRNARFGGGQAINWGPGAPRRRTSTANWRKPLKWEAQHQEFAAQHGRRQRVFCASLADVFDNAVPDTWRMELFSLIGDTPNLDWLILTKRIGNVRNYLRRDGQAFDLISSGRVWLGATMVNQHEYNRDIEKLIDLPARVTFISMEPLLGPIAIDPSHFQRHPDRQKGTEWDHVGINWVIAGGESGAGARPMSPEWPRSLRDQCARAGVPFLFKQWGEWLPMLGQADGVPVAEKLAMPDGWIMGRAGKKAAGRRLDGELHDAFPEPG